LQIAEPGVVPDSLLDTLVLYSLALVQIGRGSEAITLLDGAVADRCSPEDDELLNPSPLGSAALRSGAASPLARAENASPLARAGNASPLPRAGNASPLAATTARTGVGISALPSPPAAPSPRLVSLGAGSGGVTRTSFAGTLSELENQGFDLLHEGEDAESEGEGAESDQGDEEARVVSEGQLLDIAGLVARECGHLAGPEPVGFLSVVRSLTVARPGACCAWNSIVMRV
jgi:hypothetical protein